MHIKSLCKVFHLHFHLAPCRVENVILRENGGDVWLTWRLKLERTCSAPADLVVEFNKSRRDVKLGHPFDEAYLAHNWFLQDILVSPAIWGFRRHALLSTRPLLCNWILRYISAKIHSRYEEQFRRSGCSYQTIILSRSNQNCEFC